MKKILTLFFVLFTSTFFYGQKKLAFSEFEYPKEPIVLGRKAEKSFYFKTGNNTNISKSSIHLEIKYSQVIDRESSYLTIMLGNDILESRYITNKQEVLIFDIPLKNRYIESGFLKLTLKTDLVIEGETCKDYSYNGYWIKLTENSFLSLEKKPNLKTIEYKNISELAPQINTIVLGEKPNLVDIQYASYIKFYFERVYGNKLKITSLSALQDSLIDRSILLFPGKTLSISKRINVNIPNDNTGLVNIYRETKKDSLNNLLLGQNIVVTGKTPEAYEKAVHFTLQKNLLNSSFTKKVKVNRSTKLLNTPTRKNFEPVYFSQLGADKKMIKGIGNLSKKVGLPRFYFGSSVKKMEVQLEGKYRPVSDKEEVYLNLYFNDKLLRTYQLNSSGELDFNFEFSNIQILQENTFTYEFYHVPDGGFCDVDALFYAQLDTQKSYFKPVGYDDSESLAFVNFPENFQSSPLSIYLDDFEQSDIIEGISELIDIINPGEAGIQGFVYPIIKNATLETIDKDVNDGKIIISSNYTKFKSIYKEDPFITFKDHKVNFRSEAVSPFFNVNYDDSFGYNQLFYSNNLPIMLINVPKSSNDKTLLSLIRNIRQQNIIKTGNIIISKDTDAYFFDLRNNQKEQETSELDQIFNGYWDSYGFLIVVLLFILCLLILVYIYKKSQSSKKSVQND